MGRALLVRRDLQTSSVHSSLLVWYRHMIGIGVCGCLLTRYSARGNNPVCWNDCSNALCRSWTWHW